MHSPPTYGNSWRHLVSLRETLVFPYLRGQEFCQALYAHGGWPILADAFHHPPSSTSQILHPERFLALPRREPTPISYGNATIKNQPPAVDNVVGEFGLRLLLTTWLKDEAKAAELAADWAGDRYLFYGDARANSYVWKCAWSSEAAAREFMLAAQVGWQSRYGVKPPGTPSPNEQAGGQKTTLSSRLPDGRELLIFQENQTVTLEEAQNADWHEALEALLTPPQHP